MRDLLTRLLISLAILAVIIGISSFVAAPATPAWERIDSFGGYSLLRYEGGSIAEEKAYNNDDSLVGHRYTDNAHKTHIVTYDPVTGEETGHTVIE